jgi:hypothetical protein
MSQKEDYRYALNLINNALRQINIAIYQIDFEDDPEEALMRVVQDDSIEANLVDATKHLMDAKDKICSILNIEFHG